MKMTVAALAALTGLSGLAVQERVMIGMSGFSEAVRTEKGVKDLKEIGADFASGIPWTDRATLDLFAKYGLKAKVNGLPKWWGGKTKWAGQMAERRPLAAFEKAAATWQTHPAILSVVVGDGDWRGSAPNDTVNRYSRSRGGFVMVDPSVRRLPVG